MEITRTSKLTGITRTFDIDVTFRQIGLVEDGKDIDLVMSNLSKEEREFIKTGIVPKELLPKELKRPVKDDTTSRSSEKKPTTPVEIFEYKKRHCHYEVSVVEGADDSGKFWCKENLERYEWDFVGYTDVFEVGFRFEREDDAERFREFMGTSVRPKPSLKFPG